MSGGSARSLGKGETCRPWSDACWGVGGGSAPEPSGLGDFTFAGNRPDAGCPHCGPCCNRVRFSPQEATPRGPSPRAWSVSTAWGSARMPRGLAWSWRPRVSGEDQGRGRSQPARNQLLGEAWVARGRGMRISDRVPTAFFTAKYTILSLLRGDTGLVVKNSPASAGDMRLELDPWVGRIPWRRAWQPTPVFLPGESHGQRSLAGYSPWGCKESYRTEATCIESYELCSPGGEWKECHRLHQLRTSHSD